MHTKTLTRVRVKDEALGQIEAVFSTLGVVDSDGDVTAKGAFTDGASVVISAYGHRSWDGDLPLGKGVIREDGNDVLLEGEFFMNTTHGRDAFLTVKALSDSDLQEWSYSLEDVVSEKSTLDGRDVNLIKSVTVKEVSPVLRGAGVNTRTITAKSKFSEHVDLALSGVASFTEQALARIAERTAAGKSITEQSEALASLEAELAPLRKAIDDVTQPPVDDGRDLHPELAGIFMKNEGALRCPTSPSPN